MHNKDTNQASRRRFINTSMQLGTAVALLSVPGISGAQQVHSLHQKYTVQEIINIILKDIPAFDAGNTVDTIKAGSKDAIVSGIVTTMFPTVEVIKKAIKLSANFIIAHEPTFYNHEDHLDFVNNSDVVEKKLQLLKDNNITVWRSHDSWHAIKPDGISYGLIKKMKWTSYFKNNDVTITIPTTSLKNLISLFKSRLDIKQVRVIGNAGQLCKRIAILPGAWGGKEQITAIVNDKPDVIVVGELSEWETAEYVRDARLMGSDIALIVLGHSVSEEPGMEWMAEWLQPKIPGIQVTHVPSNNPFTWV